MLIPPPERLLTVRCPKCQHEAAFYLPYRTVSVRSIEAEAFEEAARSYRQRLVVETLTVARREKNGETIEQRIIWYFPDLYYESPWKGWDTRFGVAVCGVCFWRGKYAVQTVQDYYYRIVYRGHPLALRNREDVVTLIDFIGSKERDYRNYAPHFWRLLRRVPRPFIGAKARKPVLKKLHAALVGERTG